MINRIDGFIEEKNGDRYLNIADTDKNTEVLKKNAEVWNEIKDCIEKKIIMKENVTKIT